jgi:hypothetical protein
MMRDLFEEYRQRELRGYDTAQICLDGHVINARAATDQEHNKKFCDKCGKPTITTCQHCNTPIQGQYHHPNYAGYKYVPPRFCPECGSIYPWTEARLKDARELADELTELTDEEKEKLKQSLDDIVHDSPRTQVAASRFKRFVAKAGPGVAEMFRSLLVDIASETAKKLIFPQ